MQTVDSKPPFSPWWLALALAWSWAWWALSITSGGTETTVGALAWVGGGLGPSVAVGAALWRSGPAARRWFRDRLRVRRVRAMWWLAACVVAVAPKPVALALAALAGHAPSGEAAALGALPVSLAFGLIVVWIEEPLWRGVGIGSFRSAAAASLLVGAAWSAWHMPLFAVEGTFQHSLGLLTTDFFVFSAGVLGLSVLLTWVVVRSGSIVPAMASHMLINLTGEYLPDDTTVRIVELGVIAVGAAIVLHRLRRDSGAGRAAPVPGVGAVRA